MTTAIKVENLSKKYLINHQKKTDRYETLSETLVQGSKKIAERIMHPFSKKEIDLQTKEEFWALMDINFEINQGDKVGIIGRNGAGKSTLLKVLSRITEPTSGRISINGRVASLLEVGTGFHPELTGRENIYLNGAILGMSRQEIRAKFDEIIAFSGVEKFLDTPVKRYSSGMYVRLAFSVAAHLEPEILVVDEVLAVGDAEFQKKCLGKMNDVANDGRTILFVSHNTTMVQRLCTKGILLDKGMVSDFGEIDSVINSYAAKSKKGNNNKIKVDLNHSGIKSICLELLDEEKKELRYLINKNRDINIRLTITVTEPNIRNATFGYSLFDSNNNWLYRTMNTDTDENNSTLEQGVNVFESKIPIELLNEGEYTIILDGGIYKRNWLCNPSENSENSLSFEIEGGLSESNYWETKRNGIFAPNLFWDKKK